MSQDKHEVTLKLPINMAESINVISRLSGVKAEDVVAVCLTLYLLEKQGAIKE